MVREQSLSSVPRGSDGVDDVLQLSVVVSQLFNQVLSHELEVEAHRLTVAHDRSLRTVGADQPCLLQCAIRAPHCARCDPQVARELPDSWQAMTCGKPPRPNLVRESSPDLLERRCRVVGIDGDHVNHGCF